MDRNPTTKSSSHPLLLRAAWVGTMRRPPICDGGLVIHKNIIAAVGNWGEIRKRFPKAKVKDLGAVILLPGLVNAHTHLELSDRKPPQMTEEGFVGWIRRMMRTMPDDAAMGDAAVRNAVARGIKQCLRYGVTCVGDITANPAASREVLKNSPLRAVSFGETRGMGKRREFLETRLAAAADRAGQSDRLHIGVSPHAPYSVEIAGYRRSVALARRLHLRVATHLAESREEISFVRFHAGPLRKFWDELGAWDEKIKRHRGGPIRLARAVGLLKPLAILAHVNYCDDDELKLLAGGRASVVYCPRTHAYFRHAPHRWREMLARGINVAVGTDSCASSPNLNLVDDLRLLRKIAPDFPVMELWKLATIRAARAIGLEKQIGSLSRGKKADLVAFKVRTGDPLAEILETHQLPTRVWIDGELMKAPGRRQGR